MGVFEQFPYTNFHDLNLDWVLTTIKTLQTDVTDFVSINAIKYSNPIQWDITTQYEKNTVVLDISGNGYLSVKPVPSGISVENTLYWTVIGNFSSLWGSVKSALTVEDEGHSTTATKTRVVGDLVWLENALIEVTSNMSIGTAYAIGTNCIIYSMQKLLTSLANEATARADADTTLQTNITNEATARVNANTTLQTNITNEATARANADTTLQTNITNEATAREDADTTLQTNITNEATARANLDTTLQTTKITKNERIDFDYTPVYDINDGFYSAEIYHDVHGLNIPTGKYHHANLVWGDNNGDGVLGAYTFYLNAGVDTTIDCVRGVYGNVTSAGASAAKAVHAYAEGKVGHTGVLMAGAFGVLPSPTTSFSSCLQLVNGDNTDCAIWISPHTQENNEHMTYGILFNNYSIIDNAVILYDARGDADFLKLRDVTAVNTLFSVDKLGDVIGKKITANGGLVAPAQQSLTLNCTARDFQLQAINTDAMRIVIGGTGDGFKLYGNGGVELLGATGGSMGSGKINTMGYYVNGTQVVTTRQAAIANSTSDTASHQTTILAILSALRTHGLIAP